VTASKLLFLQYLTNAADSGSSSPITNFTPFVTRDADFQHFFVATNEQGEPPFWSSCGRIGDA
jgi:hypothetical protein